MTGTTTQIFDLMLGPAGPSPDGLAAGGDSGAVGDAPLFANLLGGFLEGQSSGQNGLDLQRLLTGVGPEQAGTSVLPNGLMESEGEKFNGPLLTPEEGVSALFPMANNHAAIESSVPGKAALMRQNLLGLSQNSEQSDRASLELFEGASTGNLSSAADTLNSTLALLPDASTLHNQSLKEMLTGGQIEVKPGSYKIIDSEVSKGQLNLTLVSSESPNEQINISLPLKMLAQDGNYAFGRTPSSGFSATNPSLMDGPVLEDYISKLKLTSLEVESSISSDGKQSVVKLFSGTADRQLLMLSQLDGNGLIGRRKLQLSSIDKIRSGEGDIDEALLESRPGAETPALRSAARPWNDSLLNRMHPLTGKPDQKLTMLSTASDLPGETAESVRMNELIGPDAKLERSSLDGGSAKIRTARLSLPEDIRTALKPGGQSVTLRIEPEHLGPARLRLSMQNNVLRALVTVDSTQAKLVVEGSLDQLTNQLSKADIQVDRIEVALNSDGRHDSFPHRKPQQQAPSKSEGSTEAVGEAMTLAGSEDRYVDAPRVGVGGVNLLA